MQRERVVTCSCGHQWLRPSGVTTDRVGCPECRIERLELEMHGRMVFDCPEAECGALRGQSCGIPQTLRVHHITGEVGRERMHDAREKLYDDAVERNTLMG